MLDWFRARDPDEEPVERAEDRPGTGTTPEDPSADPWVVADGGAETALESAPAPETGGETGPEAAPETGPEAAAPAIEPGAADSSPEPDPAGPSPADLPHAAAAAEAVQDVVTEPAVAPVTDPDDTGAGTEVPPSSTGDPLGPTGDPTTSSTGLGGPGSSEPGPPSDVRMDDAALREADEPAFGAPARGPEPQDVGAGEATEPGVSGSPGSPASAATLPRDDALGTDPVAPLDAPAASPPIEPSYPQGGAQALGRAPGVQPGAGPGAGTGEQEPAAAAGAPSLEALSGKLSDRDAAVICITNQKGGVGKTTTAVSLSAALAEAGAQVLLVDLDPQGNATTGIGLRPGQGAPSSYTVLVDEMDAEDAVEPTAMRGLHILPSSLDLAGAEIELVPAFSRELRLRRALDAVRDLYDVVIIDCPPTLGLLTVNALAAADEVLLPIQCEYYALEGVGQLTKSIDLVRRGLNPGLRVGGVLLTMFDARTRLAQQVVDEVRSHFGDIVYRTVIPRTVRLSEAPGFGQPITVFDPSSRGARAYFRLADEVAERLGLELRTLSPLDRLLGTPASAGTSDGANDREERP